MRVIYSQLSITALSELCSNLPNGMPWEKSASSRRGYEAAVASIASVSLCFLPPTDYIVLTITLRPETTLSSSLVASADTYLYSLTRVLLVEHQLRYLYHPVNEKYRFWYISVRFLPLCIFPKTLDQKLTSILGHLIYIFISKLLVFGILTSL